MFDDVVKNRQQLLIIVGLVLIILTGLVVMLWRHLAPQAANDILIQPPANSLTAPAPEEPAKILVHISGAVKRPGVYRLAPDDRVLDCLNLAGGALPNADLGIINLAEKVKDQQKIIVPEKIVAAPLNSNDNVSPNHANNKLQSSNPSHVSLNTATEAQLRQIKGIGPATAKKILEYRQANGPFCKPEDLMKVKGIGKGKFEKMKGQVTL